MHQTEVVYLRKALGEEKKAILHNIIGNKSKPNAKYVYSVGSYNGREATMADSIGLPEIPIVHMDRSGNTIKVQTSISWLFIVHKRNHMKH